MLVGVVYRYMRIDSDSVRCQRCTWHACARACTHTHTHTHTHCFRTWCKIIII